MSKTKVSPDLKCQKSSIGNSSYSKEFKLTIVKEYITGSGSIRDLCINKNTASEAWKAAA